MSSGVASASTAAIRSRLALRDRVADSRFHVSASRDSSMLSILPVAAQTPYAAPGQGRRQPPHNADPPPNLAFAAKGSAADGRFGNGSVGAPWPSAIYGTP